VFAQLRCLLGTDLPSNRLVEMSGDTQPSASMSDGEKPSDGMQEDSLTQIVSKHEPAGADPNTCLVATSSGAASHEALPGDAVESEVAEKRVFEGIFKEQGGEGGTLPLIYLRPNDWTNLAEVDAEMEPGSILPPSKKRRTKANCPSDWNLDDYLNGVSYAPQPGCQQLKVRYCHPMAWQDRTVYVHPTATAADVKWFLEPTTMTKHHHCCLVGLESGAKTPWWVELCQVSKNNPKPLETRVLMPTCEHGFATEQAQTIWNQHMLSVPRTPSPFFPPPSLPLSG